MTKDKMENHGGASQHRTLFGDPRLTADDAVPCAEIVDVLEHMIATHPMIEVQRNAVKAAIDRLRTLDE